MEYRFCVLSEKKKRVDMYISALFKEFSRSYVQKLIDGGSVMINDTITRKNIKVKQGDELMIHIQSYDVDIRAENIPLDIIYEDDSLLCINKSAPMNVHPVPGEGGNSGTLVNAVMYHCKKKLPSISGEQRPGIVHRLDKETTGVIMVAKNDAMMRYLSTIIQDRKIEKYYIAIVCGIMKEKFIEIESYIGRDKHDRKKMTIQDPINPKLALSKASHIGYIEDKYTVLRVKIETGRTHQIRVHLASIGFPIVGDKVYGNHTWNQECKNKYGLTRQALHAHVLELELYGKNKKFEGGLKPDMMALLDTINI